MKHGIQKGRTEALAPLYLKICQQKKIYWKFGYSVPVRLNQVLWHRFQTAVMKTARQTQDQARHRQFPEPSVCHHAHAPN